MWYTFTPPVTQNYSLRTCGGQTGTLDTVISVHSACPTPGANNLVPGSSCNDDACAGVNASLIPSVALSAGVTYWVRVARFSITSPAGGPFTLTIDVATSGCCNVPSGACCAGIGCFVSAGSASCLSGTYMGDGSVCSPDPCPPTGACCQGPCCSVLRQAACPGTWTSGGTCTSGQCGSISPPANDLCGAAVPLTVGVPTFGFNCTATTDATVSCTSSAKDMWYQLTADASGGAYLFDTEGSAQSDTVLALFDGCGGAQLACDDDSGTGTLSQITFTLAANQNVKVLVGSFGGSSAGGGFRLNVSLVGSGACCCGASCTLVAASACTGSLRSFAGTGSSCTPFSATTPCCRADFNKSGGPPTVQDIFDFLAAFFAAEPCADANDVGGISVQDIFDFLAGYFAGCV
jgi:hypothetical protein